MESIVTSFETACKYLNWPTVRPDVSMLPDKGQADYIATEYEVITIVKALNQEANGGKPWEPNWADGRPKYGIWVYIVKEDAGFGFSISRSDYDDSDAITFVGARLVFISAEVAIYAISRFKELYKAKLLITNPPQPQADEPDTYIGKIKQSVSGKKVTGVNANEDDCYGLELVFEDGTTLKVGYSGDEGDIKINKKRANNS